MKLRIVHFSTTKAHMARKLSTAERRQMRPSKIDENQAYSLDEAGAAIDLSRYAVRREIAAGRLRIVRNGRRKLVVGAEIVRYVQALNA